jgi:hypothetical protein
VDLSWDEVTVFDLINREKQVERMLQVMMTKLMMPGGVSNVLPQDASDLVKIASKTLTPTHYLTLRCQSEYARICASHAHGIQPAIQFGALTRTSRTPFGTLHSVRAKAGTAGLEYIRGCECIAAKCFLGGKNDGCQCCNHPPVYSCGVNAFHAFQDLKDVPRTMWLLGSVEMLSKYVPLGYIHFGNNDVDVKEMEIFLSSVATTKEQQSEAVVNNEAPTGTSNNKKGGNKKKGKLSNKQKNKRGRK